VSGALTLAVVRKLSEPSVRLAMSGRASPLSSSASARRSNAATSRPLVLTQITASGRCSRMAGMIASYAARSHAGDSSARRAWRCRMVAPASTQATASCAICSGVTGTWGTCARVGTMPVSAAFTISGS